jgi:energy-coupling factor transport system substrate-specific component
VTTHPPLWRPGRHTAGDARTAALPRLGIRSTSVIVLVSLAGIVGFGWPFLQGSGSTLAHDGDAPWLLAVVTSLCLAAALAAILDKTVDAKGIALLGVLAAVGAALRPFGAGVAGLEPMFVVLLLGGRVLGPVMGFALGSTAMLASAFLTAGIGPWLPFQMVVASWVAAGAGLLPRRVTGRAETAMLAGYALLLGPVFGALMNLWFWPLAMDPSTPIGFDPDAAAGENLHRYASFYLATSLGWDIPRGLLNATLVVLAGPRLVAALRRSVHRARFDTPIRFEAAGRPAPARPTDFAPPQPTEGTT